MSGRYAAIRYTIQPLFSEPVQPVKRGSLIAFRQGGIIENGIDKIVDRRIQRHHRLANVDQLARAFADDVNAQQLPRVAMEDQLQASGGVAAYLAARNLTIV